VTNFQTAEIHQMASEITLHFVKVRMLLFATQIYSLLFEKARLMRYPQGPAKSIVTNFQSQIPGPLHFDLS